MGDEAVGRVFAALADGTRREVLRELGRRPTVTATELARRFPISRQAVTKHLSALGDAGLVEADRHGRETRYRLTPAPLGPAIGFMAEVGAEWDARLGDLEAYVARLGASGPDSPGR